MAKTHRKRSYKASPAVEVSYLRKMRDYRILPILTVALFLYLQYSPCVDYGPPVKCTKLDPCCTRGFGCSFKHESDFEGVCVGTWIYRLSRPWPYDLVEKRQKEKAEIAKRLKMEKAAMVDSLDPLIPDPKFDSDPKPINTPFQPEPQLSGGLQPEFRFSETSITKSPDTAIDPEPEKLEIIGKAEPPSKTDNEDDHSLIPDTKPTDTPFQPEPQLSGGLQPEFNLPETPITPKSKPPGIAIDPESPKLETTTVLEPPSKTDGKESKVTSRDQEKIFLTDTEKSLGPDLGRQMEQFTTAVFGGHVEADRKGNENTGWKMTEVPMTPAVKAKMDRYQQVKQQQQKLLKMLFEQAEKIFFEQLGTTAEEREAAARAKRSHQLYMWKKHQDTNTENKDETPSSHSIPEQVVEKADNIQQDSRSDGTEISYNMQYGLHGNGNPVSINGHGFAEGPAVINDGNATTKFSPREDKNLSLDADRSMGKLLPVDPISTEGMPDNPVIYSRWLLQWCYLPEKHLTDSSQSLCIM